jgi:hypothetical protein
MFKVLNHLNHHALVVAVVLIAVILTAVQPGALGFEQPRSAEAAGHPAAEQKTKAPGSVSAPRTEQPADETASPIFGVSIPDGFRRWELISVSEDAGKNELKGIFGDAVSMKAYREGKLPFPDGSTLVKVTWKREPLAGFEGAFVPGAKTMVQVMLKDAKKYAETGGWGFGRFVDGKPVDAAQHKTCFACHSKTTAVKEHDYVFTLLAP